MKWFSIWASTILCAATLAMQAGAEQAVQPHEEFKTVIHLFIVAKIGNDYPSHQIEIGSLDPRLRLAACGKPLRVFLPGGDRVIGHITLGVSCPGQAAWTVYIPATVKVKGEVVVVINPVKRGDIITAQDVRLEVRELNANDLYIRDPSHAIGKAAKRGLTLNSAVTAAMLSPPLLIRRGQEVVLIANVPGIDVRMQGIALSDGSARERIQVRNNSSRRTVEATVIEAGVAQVTM